MEPSAGDEQVRVTLEDGLIRLLWAPGVTITATAAENVMEQVDRLCGSTRRPMLVDMAGTASVTRAARKVFLRPCAANAMALLGRSPVDRVIANFILGISDFATPTKFFTTESAAVTWLKSLPATGGPVT